MSDLGTISAKLEREEEHLRILNDALLVLEVDSLGKSDIFDYSNNDIKNSRKIIIDFLNRLIAIMDDGNKVIDFVGLIEILKADMKPYEDWYEDLAELLAELKDSKKLTEQSMTTIEELLSILEDEFGKDIQKLYAW